MTLRPRRPNRRAAMPAALPIALAAALSLAACATRDEPVVHRQVQKLAPVEVPPEDAEKIRRYFLRSYISIRTFDRPTATIARQLIWDHGLQTRDAMHLATAIRWKLPLLETFDVGDLVSLSGKVGNPAIEIRLPRYDIPEQTDEAMSGADQLAMEFDELPE